MCPDDGQLTGAAVRSAKGSCLGGVCFPRRLDRHEALKSRIGGRRRVKQGGELPEPAGIETEEHLIDHHRLSFVAGGFEHEVRTVLAEQLRGVINQRWQKLEDAASDYQIASDKAPTELAFVLARAETLVAMDRAKEALSLLQEKQPFFENNPVIRDAAGQLLMQQKRYSEAVDTFRKASMLATDDIGIKERLAKAMLFNNQSREAAELLSRLTRDERNAERSELYVMLGEACMQADRASQARAAFETAAQINPSSSLAWQGIGKVALNANDLRRAEMAIRKSLALEPADPQALLLTGYLRLRQSKLDEAMVAFRKAAALDQADAVALCMTGYILERMGDQQQAMDFYAKALRVRPGDELATQLMANIGLNE